MSEVFKVEGIEQTVAALDELSKATQKNIVRRTLLKAGEPMAELASDLAPVARGILAFSVVVSKDLSARHKSEQKEGKSQVEVYIGPTGLQGATYYASAVEFGTIVAHAQPFMRPAWEAMKEPTLALISTGLAVEVDKAAQRAARKAARLAVTA